METPSAPSPHAAIPSTQARSLFRCFPPVAAALVVSGCSLVTVPVKTAGSIVNTTIKTTGSVVEAPFKAAGGGYPREDKMPPDRKPSKKEE